MAEDNKQSEPRDGSSKGKGKATDADGSQRSIRDEAASRGSSTLLGSVLKTGASSDASSSLAGLLSSQGKAASHSQSSRIGGTSAASIATEQARGPSSSSTLASSLGPRAGFRTTASADQPVPNTSQDTTSAASLIASTNGLDSLQALDAALHEAVRRETNTPGVSAALEDATYLDPSYHEAWARSIPALDLSSSTAPMFSVAPSLSNDEQEEDDAQMKKAWERAMFPSPKDEAATVLQPRYANPWAESDAANKKPPMPTAEQGGLLALLAAEEEDQVARTGIPADRAALYTAMTSAAPGELREEDPTVRLPPPDLASIQSTDPREALAFLLDDPETQRAKAERQLTDLKRRLELEASVDGDTAQASATVRRRERRRALAQIEYDMAILARKLGYAEEVWINEARGYPTQPDFSRLDDDEAEPSDEDLDRRRHRAVERLESLRRHLEGKL